MQQRVSYCSMLKLASSRWRQTHIDQEKHNVAVRNKCASARNLHECLNPAHVGATCFKVAAQIPALMLRKLGNTKKPEQLRKV